MNQESEKRTRTGELEKKCQAERKRQKERQKIIYIKSSRVQGVFLFFISPIRLLFQADYKNSQITDY